MMRALAVFTVLAFAVVAQAHWEPGDPAKWVQFPDLEPTGIDVNATGPHILADDFPCTQTGPITDIHIWGSWRNDYLPFGSSPERVRFILSIHADVPDSLSPTGFSMPGEPLWWRVIGPEEFTVRPYLDGIDEGWMDPPEGYVFPGDHTCWQYNFQISEDQAFWQQGSPDNRIVYWLDVQAIPEDQEAFFGWKTSPDHWNDDAVWVYGEEPYYEPWFRLTYPPGHPFYPQSIDLAFVVNGHEVQTSKWEQRPDLEETGIDVFDCEPFSVLADDFLCTEPGRITGIDVWGSWLDDYVPSGDPGSVQFTLSLHADIAADTLTGEWSRPGELLWLRSFVPGEFGWQIYAENLLEGWLEPPDLYFWPGDSICWLYTFPIDPYEAFHQLGTPDEPIVYWLDVQATPYDANARFGWKTSVDHWNDDAVWGQGFEPYFDPWWELRYPPEHPFFPESIDLAFRIHSTYATDAPDDVGSNGYGLKQNTPNPFNPVTTIGYSVPAGGGQVTIEIIDVAGRVVRRLVGGHQTEGRHAAAWDGRDEKGQEVGSGVYFYRMTAPDTKITRKMILLK